MTELQETTSRGNIKYCHFTPKRTFAQAWHKRCRNAILNELLQSSQLFHCPPQPLSVSLSCLSSENNLHSVAERTEALFRLNGGKAEGWGGREGDAPAVGGQDNRTASHMWAGGGRARGLWELHTVALLQGGVQLIRFGEMDHSLKSSPWEALTQNTPASVYGSLSWRNPESCKSRGSQVVFTPQEWINIELYKRESGSNGTWDLVMTSQCDGRAAESILKA